MQHGTAGAALLALVAAALALSALPAAQAAACTVPPAAEQPAVGAAVAGDGNPVYTVFYKQEVTQAFGGSDTYHLGTYADGESGLLHHTFRNGDFCGAVNAPRKAYVTYRCNPEATTPVLAEASEPWTCVYNFIVDAQWACAAPPN